MLSPMAPLQSPRPSRGRGWRAAWRKVLIGVRGGLRNPAAGALTARHMQRCFRASYRRLSPVAQARCSAERASPVGPRVTAQAGKVETPEAGPFAMARWSGPIGNGPSEISPSLPRHPGRRPSSRRHERLAKTPSNGRGDAYCTGGFRGGDKVLAPLVANEPRVFAPKRSQSGATAFSGV